jgi:hypothetical protein
MSPAVTADPQGTPRPAVRSVTPLLDAASLKPTATGLAKPTTAAFKPTVTGLKPPLSAKTVPKRSPSADKPPMGVTRVKPQQVLATAAAKPAATPATARKAAMPSTAGRKRDDSDAAMATVLARLGALEAETAALRGDNVALRDEVAVLRAAQNDTDAARAAEAAERAGGVDAAFEARTTENLMNLNSQVQFAIAWIQQVDRHLSDTAAGGASRYSDEDATTVTDYSPHDDATPITVTEDLSHHSSHMSPAGGAGLGSAARRLDMSTDSGSRPQSRSRLPPSPPVALHQE